jgi:endonuclease III
MPMTPQDTRIYTLFSRFAQHNPTPTTELIYTNPFTLLVAVVLSAQMTDKGVNKVTQTLFQHISHPQDILDQGGEWFEQAIRSINFYRNKAKHVLKLCQQLIDHHGGEVPRTREALEALAGVGRKTANVVLNTAFHEPTMAVDTHIFRVSHRLGLSQGKTPLDVEQDLLKVIPADFMHDAHHWLILHGRYVCKARKPVCEQCLVSDLCPSTLLPL